MPPHPGSQQARSMGRACCLRQPPPPSTPKICANTVRWIGFSAHSGSI
ncbi:hypothetical protein AH4AK4_0094 [Aeromonas hydrophila 4AK4]|nr:hypothetical protein AH4AK4_0094 [Aeromonas hydrophila 4AK4]